MVPDLAWTSSKSFFLCSGDPVGSVGVPVSSVQLLTDGPKLFKISVKLTENSIVSMVVVKTFWYMYTFFWHKNGNNQHSNFICCTGNPHWCPLVPTKLQVRECSGCFNIWDLKCEVGVTVYTYCGFILEIHAFSGAIYMNTVKVFREGGPVPCWRKWSQKQK